MSDKERPSINQIITAWKYRHGERFYKREAQLKELFDKMKEHGYDKEALSPSVQKTLIGLMHLATYKTAKAWKKCVEQDLEKAMYLAWPDEAVGPWKDFDPEAMEEGVVKTEKPEPPPPPPVVEEEPQERMLDLEKMSEGIELEEINHGALLEELGIKGNNGRSE